MDIVSSLSDASLDQPCVASIGNFDGLHLGHRAILDAVVRRARELGLRSGVLTFEPHPIEILAPDKAPRRISTLSQKAALIREAGIDLLFVARFDHAFARLSPESFVRQYLLQGLKARSVCVGSNFNFGHQQAGTVETLAQWRSDFEVVEVPSVQVRGVRVSSTAIRQMTAGGFVSRAGRLLGRCLEIEGKIVSGAGRGRQETVPTLNLAPENELIPGRGVYVSRISLDGSAYLDSITNVGVRPTFQENQPGESPLTIETYVLAPGMPAAPLRARLQFVHRLRDERRFQSAETLRQQISRDVQQALKFFRLMRTIGHASYQD